MDLKKEVLEKLANPSTSFLDKFRMAVNLNLDIWVDRDPPNLGEDELKKLLRYIPANVSVTWVKRDSQSGPHGTTGDDDVFKFEFKVGLLGWDTTYFVKGYFFDKGACCGVCVQSFRVVRKNRQIRLVRK